MLRGKNVTISLVNSDYDQNAELRIRDDAGAESAVFNWRDGYEDIATKLETLAAQVRARAKELHSAS